MPTEHDFEKLLAFLRRLPALKFSEHPKAIAHGTFETGNWWVKFSLDTDHPLAWRHVQELGHVLNYVSLNERLPTVFKPVSPPPYLNGGVEFLSWVIESTDIPSDTEGRFTPNDCAAWLAARLPDPVEAATAWTAVEE